MRHRSACVIGAAILLAAFSLYAGDLDGITLLINYDATPGAVRLDWTGGQPVFEVFRSVSPSGLASPGNRVGLTRLQSLADTPPLATIQFYEVAVCSPGIEVCNGFDDDCDGFVDDGVPGVGAPCDGPDSDLCAEGTTSCSAGALVCSDTTDDALDLCNGLDDDCDLASTDGSEDPRIGEACDGPDSDLCAEGTASCSAGALKCSDATGSTVELCNGIDDDCDGTTDVLWSVALPSAAVALAPVNDTGLTPAGGSRTYVAQGNRLYAFSNSTGVEAWSRIFPFAISSLANPVRLSLSGELFLFLAGGDDGFLYKVRASDGQIHSIADTRRPGHPTDKLVATPAVQLYNSSNLAFQVSVDVPSVRFREDLVFVITRIPDNGEPFNHPTQNRVIAYFASDLATKWTFNANGKDRVDFGGDGCAVDYDTNRLYCGTNHVKDTAENSLFALSSLTGVRLWSHAAGPLVARPILAGGSLYVATKIGSIMKFDPDGNGSGGALPLWTTPVALPDVVRNVWPEYRGGVFQNKILALDSSGTLHAIVDKGSSGDVAWSNSSSYVSMPVVHPSIGTAYIGRNDGFVQQIDLHDGQSDASIQVGTSTVFDPSLDRDGGGPDFNRLTVVARDASGTTSTLSRVCAPVAATPPGFPCLTDGDCTDKTTACTVGRCDPASGACWGQPIPDGTPCSDGDSCSTNDTCTSGKCLSQSYTTCSCVQVGDRACAPNLTCCGQVPGCVDLQNDVFNCGACGYACGEDQNCAAGNCQTDPGQCAAGLTDELTLSSSARSIPGADALAYDRTADHVCSAYVSTYRTTSNSSVDIIDPDGLVDTFPFSLDFSPLHGVAVPKQGKQILAAFVNGLSSTAGLGVVDPLFGLTRPLVTSGTVGSGPFTDSRFNRGPVGPAFDHSLYNGSDNSRTTWFGNWSLNGDLIRVEYGGSWTANLELLWTRSPNRITAIAFERRMNRQLPIPAKQRYLFIGHGTTLSLLNLDTGLRTDLDLANPAVYGGVSSILSIAVHPRFGDILLEVKNSAGERFVVDISGHDDSVRHLADVQTDLNTGPVIPQLFSLTEDACLVIMPTGDLLRMITIINEPPVFTKYGLPK